MMKSEDGQVYFVSNENFLSILSTSLCNQNIKKKIFNSEVFKTLWFKGLTLSNKNFAKYFLKTKANNMC